MISLQFRFTLLTLVATFACTPKESSTQEQDIQEQSVVSVNYLKTLYSGACEEITENIIIEGQIVANDMMGEFGDVIYLQDESGGVAINCEVEAADYPYGSYLRVVCNGLWLSQYGGKIELGAKPTDSSSVEVIESDDISQFFTPLERTEEPTARLVTIPVLAAEYISTLVKIEQLSFVIDSDDEQYCQRSSETGRAVTTIRTATDADNNSIQLLFLYSCDYGDVAMATTAVDIYAILDFSSGEYTLRVVNFQIFQ